MMDEEHAKYASVVRVIGVPLRKRVMIDGEGRTMWALNYFSGRVNGEDYEGRIGLNGSVELTYDGGCYLLGTEDLVDVMVDGIAEVREGEDDE